MPIARMNASSFLDEGGRWVNDDRRCGHQLVGTLGHGCPLQGSTAVRGA